MKEKEKYEKPEIKRVELAVEETLSSGCKSFDDCEDVGNPAEGS